jgi:hypothetical protein
MIVEKEFLVGNKKYHFLLKTFKDCGWAGTKYLIAITHKKINGITHICSWSDENGFHVWVEGNHTTAVATMKEMKILLLKHLTNS